MATREILKVAYHKPYEPGCCPGPEPQHPLFCKYPVTTMERVSILRSSF